MSGAAPWIAVGLLALAAVLLIVPGSEQVLVEAPDFSLENLSGETVTLSALRGQIVVLDFWASWCKPCTRTLPALVALVHDFADRGAVLLAVSLDRTTAAAGKYAAEEGLNPSSVLYGSLEKARGVKALYDVVAIPRTFVIDRKGLVRYSGSPSGVGAGLLSALAEETEGG